MKPRLRVLILLLAGCLLAACQSPAPAGPAASDVPPATLTSTAIPPTETPIATATPVPTGPCDNPLMSLNVGNWWRYRSTSTLGSSDEVLRVLEWNEEMGLNAVIEMTDMESGVVTTDWVTCQEGGAIEDFPLFFVSMQMADYMDGVFNTYYNSGIYSPPYAEFNENGWVLGWEAEYLTEEGACFTKIVPDTSMCINLSSPIILTFDTQGEYEAVSVPAGDFPQALKVTFLFRMATTLNFPGIATSAPMTVTTRQWYVPFLGLVRSEVETASFEIYAGQPSEATVDSVVELMEYNIEP